MRRRSDGSSPKLRVRPRLVVAILLGSAAVGVLIGWLMVRAITKVREVRRQESQLAVARLSPAPVSSGGTGGTGADPGKTARSPLASSGAVTP